MKLPDGTVIDYSYHPMHVETRHGPGRIKRFDGAKVGTIIAVRNVDSTAGLQQSANVNKDDINGIPYETVYDVRIDENNAAPFIFTNCRALKPFFGATNFFDMVHEASNQAEGYSDELLFNLSAESMIGARCVIVCIEKHASAPVILGFLQHPARTSTITEDKGLHMEFEFNGMNVMIDKDGALTITGNGPWTTPISPPIGPVPDNSIPEDPTIGPFTFQITKDMQLMISDNVGQEFRIDRVAFEMELTNGSESILISQTDANITVNVGQEFSVTSGIGDTISVSAKDGLQGSTPSGTSFSFKNGEVEIDSVAASLILSQSGDVTVDGSSISLTCKTGFSVESDTTIAIKGAGGELLDLINQLITAIGSITVASPVGPCAPIMGAPQWAQVQQLLVQLKLNMG